MSENIPHSLGGFRGAFESEHGRKPTDQEIWNAAIRSWRDITRQKSDAVKEQVVEDLLPVGELTLEQITRIYDRYGGDMVNCTRAIERELAAARSQPTTEESLVVAGAQPVREPLTPDTHYQEWKHGCDSMCTNITLWIDRCPHCGKPRPVVEAAHGITKKGE